MTGGDGGGTSALAIPIKVLAYSTHPRVVALLLTALALAGWALGRPELLLACGALVAVGLTLLATDAGARVLGALARRVPPAELPAQLDGIVVLAGSTGRLRAFAELCERFPTARRAFVGGAGARWRGGAHAADAARARLAELGLAPDSVEYEATSRSTHENARASHAALAPGPDETWVLVTCDWHMPRALGAFRGAGWNPLPRPVPTDPRARGRVARLRLAIKELAALLAYRCLRRQG